MKAKDLIKFVLMSESEPARQCSCCGDIAHWPEMKQAKIFPFTDEEEDVCFVVCGENCENAFLSFPALDNFIMKAVQEFQAHKKLDLKIDYRVWFQQIDQLTTNN